ncbi:MAG: AAA family ATPase [Deltaproteobacteria bacterium]|nr:AAA family ATPase [Deltaproteobacteria bacterium]
MRGARQTGKSRLVEEFGKTEYDHLVVVNLEKEPRLKALFDRAEPAEIVRELEIIKNTPIQEGKTLIFIDEIQEYPPAIAKLRFFYEDLPGHHVIAAGSLLEFVLEREQLSFPVGRVDFHYVFPLSFIEFLHGGGHDRLAEALQHATIHQGLSTVIHDEARKILKEYLLVGGMPEAALRFFETGHYRASELVKESILETYRDDFKKYSKRVNIDNLDAIFREVPRCVGERINLSRLCGAIRGRDASIALKLLQRAMLLLRVDRVQSVSFPLRPFKKTQPKLLFLDLGLVQNANRISTEIIESANYSVIYKGGFAEQFVGQELIALLSGHRHPELFYWQRENRGATAEVDYLLPYRSYLLPVEVKAGRGKTLFSLHQFMVGHQAPIAIRIYDGPLQLDALHILSPKITYRLLSVPLYMVSSLFRLLANVL